MTIWNRMRFHFLNIRDLRMFDQFVKTEIFKRAIFYMKIRWNRVKFGIAAVQKTPKEIVPILPKKKE